MYFINCFLFHNHEQVQPFSWSDLFNFDRLHLKKEKKKGTRFTHLLNRPHALSPVSPPAERSRHHSHSPVFQCTAQSSSIPSNTLYCFGLRNRVFLALKTWSNYSVAAWFVHLSPGKEWLSLPSVWRGNQPPTQQIPHEHHADGSAGSITQLPFPRLPLPTRGGGAAAPYTCLRSLCYMRTDRTDRFYAAAGCASSSLSAENRLRMQPQAQGPGRTHRRRRFELIVWVVRPLARKPMSILAFSPQGHSSHLCVQPVTG